MSILPALQDVLSYQHPAVLKLYEQNYPNNTLSAEIAFREALKYLWLTQKHLQDHISQPNNPLLPSECIMLRSMREIDEMWHEFILFTEDYMNFCERYFGKYIHHLPNVFDNAPIPRDQVEADLEKLLPYIYDQLGEESLRIWFASYLNNQ